MTRFCPIMKKGVQTGNNVSHANNKTRRRFLPNLHSVSFVSEILDRSFSLRISSQALRTIESKGGLDPFLLQASPAKLPPSLKKALLEIQAKTKNKQ